ncbi:MAG: FKBP-type peptidyl-prolyl cis-trans isomerase SlyD [Syntrophorhabdus sp. PtaU1.Bin153]|nr:MAG: FKBP-type peptidyl-prolyl cis-trans isomerase SlyD [Syntrophorhabdus sp. PtaU1.Bin153]
MVQAKVNDKVKVHYTGYLTDGNIFDSSLDREPMEVTIGERMVIPAFENGIVGMAAGDTKTIRISADDAYGPYREDLVGTIARSQLPADIEPQVGMVLQAHGPDGGVTLVTVKELRNDDVILDANHPLAGQDLVFEIKLVEIA